VRGPSPQVGQQSLPGVVRGGWSFLLKLKQTPLRTLVLASRIEMTARKGEKPLSSPNVYQVRVFQPGSPDLAQVCEPAPRNLSRFDLRGGGAAHFPEMTNHEGTINV